MPRFRSSVVLVLVLSIAISLLACGGPVETTGPTITDPGAQRLDEYLDRLSNWGFSGVILVARDGEVILERGYGYADREAPRQVDVDTVFTVGSITKQFTAAAILRLEGEGLLSVDDPITRYFDDVPEDKRAITLHQLLTHSAGFPGGVGDDFEPVEREDYVRLALETELEFEPGSGYEYSNVGYSLLGAIIEQISGRDYESYLRATLFEPAGMPATGYRLPGWETERLAVGYGDGERWGTVVERPWADDGPYWNLRANGGIHSTVGDMYRWLDVVRAPGILPAEQHEKWLTPYVDEGQGDSFYAYGWVVHDTDSGKLIAHNGGNGIFGADFFWLPDEDLFVYVASNSSRFDSTQMRERILDALLETPPPLPPLVSTVPLDASVVARLSGTYVADSGTLMLDSDSPWMVARLSGQALLDTVLAHGAEQRDRFAKLGALATGFASSLGDRREDAFDPLYEDNSKARERARRVLGLVERQERFAGPLLSVEHAGTIAPPGRYPLPDEATAVSHIVARFAEESVVLGMLWDDGDRYLGLALGPLSDLTTVALAPVEGGRFEGWIEGRSSGTIPVEVVDVDGGPCLILAGSRLCRQRMRTVSDQRGDLPAPTHETQGYTRLFEGDSDVWDCHVRAVALS